MVHTPHVFPPGEATLLTLALLFKQSSHQQDAVCDGLSPAILKKCLVHVLSKMQGRKDKHVPLQQNTSSEFTIHLLTNTARAWE